MSLLYLQSHNAMSFNLEHINILFHAFSVCSSGLLCPLIYLCFRPRHILIQKRQFYFDSYLYVKCEEEEEGVLSLLLYFAICWSSLFCPGIVQDILSVDYPFFLTIFSAR